MASKPRLYEGEYESGMRQGDGKISYPLGGNEMFTYDGAWNKGMKAGGKLTISGLSSYEGDFDNSGEITGVGTRTWDDGRVYVGQWYLGEMNGKGKWTKKCKDIDEMYEGDFIDNRRQGNGVYDNGNVIYSGSFASHKFNGKGEARARDNSFVMEGNFVDGIIEGQATIQWKETSETSEESKNISSMQCETWIAGLPTGNGSYRCHDNSYEFEGNFESESGKLNQDDIASYLWSSVDRTELIAQEEEAAEAAIIAAGGKPGKKAPPKKGEETSLLTVPAGACLGKLVVRAGSVKHIAAQEIAAAVPAKGKKGSAPAEDNVLAPPEPPAGRPIPCERRRLLKLTLRSITYNEDDSSTPPIMSDPLPLWLRNKTQEEYANDALRFPIHAIEYLNGELRPKPDDIASKGFPSKILLEGGTEESVADSTGSNVVCHLVPYNASLSVNLVADDVKGASDGLNCFFDLKFDCKSIFDHVVKDRRRIRAEAIEATKAQTEAILETKASEQDSTIASDGHGNEISVESAVQTKDLSFRIIDEPEFAEISIFSLSRMDGEEELLDSKLDLVLLVPSVYFKDNESGEVDDCENVTENTESISKEKTYIDKWESIKFELRCSALQKDKKSDANIVCARWEGDTMHADHWHSIALSINASSSECAHLVLDGVELKGIGDMLRKDSILDWLPEQKIVVIKRDGGNESKDNNNYQSTEDMNTEEEEEEEEAKKDPADENLDKNTTKRQVIRCGGKGFSGAVKSMALCSMAGCEIRRITSCFKNWRAQESIWAEYKYNDWYSRASITAKKERERSEMHKIAREEENRIKADDKELKRRAAEEAGTDPESESGIDSEKIADESLPPMILTDVRYDCKIEMAVPIDLFCGETSFDRIFIPSNLLPGKYVIQVDDCVDSRCVLNEDDLKQIELKSPEINKEENEEKESDVDPVQNQYEPLDFQKNKKLLKPKRLEDLYRQNRTVRALPSLKQSISFTVTDPNAKEE